MDIAIVLPAQDTESDWAEAMIMLTRAIEKSGRDISGGCLGGEYGYGGDYENDVFKMFPFYWGDCTCGYEKAEWDWSEANAHEDSCYQNLVDDDLMKFGWKRTSWGGLDAPEGMSYDASRKIEGRVRKARCKEFGLPYPNGCAVHCTCSYKDRWAGFLAENQHKAECPTVWHNFLHKPSGVWVDWYKYIGRGMEVNNPQSVSPAVILKECIESIN